MSVAESSAALRERLNEAEVRYAEASSRMEAALLSGNPLRKWEALRETESWCGVVTVRRWAYLNALRREAPSWTSLLRDPTSQPKGAEAVMASILAYQNATTGTADATPPKAVASATVSDDHRPECPWMDCENACTCPEPTAQKAGQDTQPDQREGAP